MEAFQPAQLFIYFVSGSCCFVFRFLSFFHSIALRLIYHQFPLEKILMNTSTLLVQHFEIKIPAAGGYCIQ